VPNKIQLECIWQKDLVLEQSRCRTAICYWKYFRDWKNVG
jgi:hypothetical protein